MPLCLISTYLPKPPFGGDSQPIVAWRRLTGPGATAGENGKTVYRFETKEPLPAGDYGLVLEGTEPGTEVEIALAPAEDGTKLIGTWLGPPGSAVTKAFGVARGQSALDGAIYFHALKPYTVIVLRLSAALPEWNELQLARLNPKHQMPTPKINNMNVELK